MINYVCRFVLSVCFCGFCNRFCRSSFSSLRHFFIVVVVVIVVQKVLWCNIHKFSLEEVKEFCITCWHRL
jgi:hypothetical protein